MKNRISEAVTEPGRGLSEKGTTFIFCVQMGIDGTGWKDGSQNPPLKNFR
jgi:hypothetical protein